MRLLVVGSGGREHALCWSLAASPLCDMLYCTPGNAGIARQTSCVPIPATDSEGLVRFATEAEIDLVVVGPEVPLVAGLVDRLSAAGIDAFGPDAAAARLEGSKGFLKDLCQTAGIPAAPGRRFTDSAAARAWIDTRGTPIVVKADGLAAGKGVVVATTVAEAHAAVDAALDRGVFGPAGAAIVVESVLHGEEMGFFVLSDGRTALPLGAVRDYKRAGAGNRGPNTGGMGAVSLDIGQDLQDRIMDDIVHPTLRAMRAAGHPFRGLLYAGLMLTADGPFLLEYNVRFGDPECQVLTMRLRSDLLPALLAVRDGALDTVDLRWRAETALTVVMTAPGYPQQPRTGSVIGGLEAAAATPHVQIFHAGTARASDGRLVAAGGRVLNIAALGADVAQARQRAYDAIDKLEWPEGVCRPDIGL